MKKSFECNDQLKCNQIPSCSRPGLPRKCGRKSVTLADIPCQKEQSKIFKSGLCNVASFAQEHGVEKEVIFQRLVEEAILSHKWNMSLFMESLRGHSEIPIPELTSLFYVANLSQRQYQMCLKYNVTAFEPRYKVDTYKKFLYPSVALYHLSASVDVQDLFESTLHAILSNEDLFYKLSDLPADFFLTLSAKIGLGGSG